MIPEGLANRMRRESLALCRKYLRCLGTALQTEIAGDVDSEDPSGVACPQCQVGRIVTGRLLRPQWAIQQRSRAALGWNTS